jgi:hypothetical protein
MLSRFGRRLAVERARTSTVPAARPTQKRKEVEVTTTLTVLRDGTYYVEAGRTERADRGDVIVVSRPSVVASLVVAKLAVHGEVDLRERGARPTTAATAATAALTGEGDGSAVSAGAGRLRWSDVPGISQASLELLERHAPDADPRTATDDELLRWLGDSKQRTVYVAKALEPLRETETEDEG